MLERDGTVDAVVVGAGHQRPRVCAHPRQGRLGRSRRRTSVQRRRRRPHRGGDAPRIPARPVRNEPQPVRRLAVLRCLRRRAWCRVCAQCAPVRVSFSRRRVDFGQHRRRRDPRIDCGRLAGRGRALGRSRAAVRSHRSASAPPPPARQCPRSRQRAPSGAAGRALGKEWPYELARLALQSPRELAEEHFETDELRSLVAAWGIHLDFAPDVSGGAIFPLPRDLRLRTARHGARQGRSVGDDRRASTRVRGAWRPRRARERGELDQSRARAGRRRRARRRRSRAGPSRRGGERCPATRVRRSGAKRGRPR